MDSTQPDKRKYLLPAKPVFAEDRPAVILDDSYMSPAAFNASSVFFSSNPGSLPARK